MTTIFGQTKLNIISCLIKFWDNLITVVLNRMTKSLSIND